MPEETCTWTNDSNALWLAACGYAEPILSMSVTPEPSHVNCPGCGKPIAQAVELEVKEIHAKE